MATDEEQRTIAREPTRSRECFALGSWRVSPLLPLAFLSLAALGCAPRRPAVTLGSPHDHYDHNRTRRISIEGWRNASPIEVAEEAYTPVGSKLLPQGSYASGTGDEDNLCPAQFVPVFPGVQLPLATASDPGSDGPSDREDLIDFLSEGPDAQVAVAAGQGTGDQAATERKYGRILELLSERTALKEDGRALREWVETARIPSTDRVNDSRYRRSAFKRVLAIGCDDFWFVLYEPPGQTGFTRLVVVPIPTKGQNFEGKRPFSVRQGMCEKRPAHP